MTEYEGEVDSRFRGNDESGAGMTRVGPVSHIPEGILYQEQSGSVLFFDTVIE